MIEKYPSDKDWLSDATLVVSAAGKHGAYLSNDTVQKDTQEQKDADITKLKPAHK